jgi:hypothetical protein
MKTLMRTLKLLSLAVVFVAGTALQVNAQAPDAATQAPAETPQTPAETPQAPVETPQTPAEKPPAPVMPPQAPVAQPPSQPAQDNQRDRFFFNVSFGGQAREQTFTESATFTKYNEPGAVATSHAIGGKQIFDVGAGMRVWKGLAIGVAYSSFKDDDDAGVTARVPHPILFGNPRTESVVATGLEHTENVVHLQFMWMIPYRDRFQLALMAGPSFFTVRQDLATVRPADIADPAPLIESITVTNVKESPVGFNVGADGSYRIFRMGGVGLGIGLFARYVAASLSLPNAAGATTSADLKGGGFQGGGGLRLGF